MHVAKVVRPYKDREYTYWFLRQTYREDGKVKHRTLANLSALPPEVIELVARALKGEQFIGAGAALRTLRTLPHGHVAAVLGPARSPRAAGAARPPAVAARELATALVVARVLAPASKLATAGWLPTRRWRAASASRAPTRTSCTPPWTGCSAARPEGRGSARPPAPGAGSARAVRPVHHVRRGTLLPARADGHSRDHRPDRPQVEFGLLTEVGAARSRSRCSRATRPTRRPWKPRSTSCANRFGLAEIVLVGDRGMLTSARIERLRETGGIGWVSCLRAPAIRGLVEAGDLQLSLFDERNLAEIRSPEFPGERLVVCRNPALAAERTRKREALLVATEAALAKVAAAVERGRLETAAAIGLRAGRVVNAKKMAKHFELDDRRRASSAYHRRTEAIAAEAALDGMYVVRTVGVRGTARRAAVVETYKRLSAVERDFRALKGDDLLSGRSSTGRRTGCGRTCSCASWRPTCAGTSRLPGPPCCSATRRRPRGPTRSRPAGARRRPGQGGRPRSPTGCRSEVRAAARASRHAHRAPGHPDRARRAGRLLAAGRAHGAPRPCVRAARPDAGEPCSQSAAAHSAGFVLECARRALEVRSRRKDGR